MNDEAAPRAELARAQGACGPAAAVRPARILMLATLFNMPYRVLRCARATGAEVLVLGNPGARPLRFSRHCRRFVLSDCVISGERDAALALEINCLARDQGVDAVIAGDAPSTRALIAIRDLVDVACFPMPSLETFDRLNDKWAFAGICEALGIAHPPTRLLADAGELRARIASGELALPLVLKPLSRSGNGGVIILDGKDTAARIRAVNYRPVLVQDFIPGIDIGASIFAREGKVVHFVLHRFWHQEYSTFLRDEVSADIARLAAHFHLDGVYNFDMRQAPDGRISYLECNPRFFFKINLSMIAGINFVACGFRPASEGPGRILDGEKVRLPKALAYSLLTSARCSRRDWAMARYLLGDPLPWLMERLGLTL